jgi:hypothetical protein
MVFDHHVGALDDGLGDRLAAGRQEVDVDPALGAVHRHEVARQLVRRRVLRLDDLPAAPPVRPVGGFDLQHVGAQVAQVAGGQRPGPAHAEVGDAHPGHRPARAAARPGRGHAVEAEAEGQGGAHRPRLAHGRERSAPRPVGHAGQVPGPRRRGDRDAGLLAGLHPVVGRALGDQRRQQRVQFVGADRAVGRGGQARVLDEVGTLDQRAQRRPLRGGQGGDADVTVRGRIDRGRIDRGVAVDAVAARQGQRIGRRGHDARLGEAERRFQHIDVHPARPIRPGHQRRQAADEAVQPGQRLGGVALGQDRWAFRQAERKGDAAQGQDHRIIAAPAGVGAALAEPGDAQPHDAGAPGQGRVDRFDQRGGLADDDQRLVGGAVQARQRGRQVRRDRLAVVEPGGEGPARRAGMRHRIVRTVADLDDAGAELGHQPAAIAGGDLAPRLDHPQPGQGPSQGVRRHRLPPTLYRLIVSPIVRQSGRFRHPGSAEPDQGPPPAIPVRSGETRRNEGHRHEPPAS